MILLRLADLYYRNLAQFLLQPKLLKEPNSHLRKMLTIFVSELYSWFFILYCYYLNASFISKTG